MISKYFQFAIVFLLLKGKILSFTTSQGALDVSNLDIDLKSIQIEIDNSQASQYVREMND